MAQILNYEYIEVLDGGSHIINSALPTDVYVYHTTGTVTLTSNYPITISGSPVIGTTIDIIFITSITDNNFHFVLNGTTVVYSGLVNGPCKVSLFYTGSAWNQVWSPSLFQGSNSPLSGELIVEETIGLDSRVANVDNSINLTKLLDSTRGYLIRAGASGIHEEFQAKTSGQIVMGNGTDVSSVAMSGDATINGSGVITIASNAITTAKINTAQVTVSKLEASAQLEVITIPVSFESGELTSYKFKMPYPGSITNIYAECVKAIANTDAATITPKNNAGTTMTVTTPISFAASDPLTTAYTSAITGNNTFIAGDIITLLTAKVTAGGKALVSLTIQRA